MAKSHHDVGIAFGKCKSATGSRMSTLQVQPVSPHQDDMNAHYNKTFYLVQTGVSYRTVVARIVRNTHTKRNELWITPRRYSSSTERHKSYYLNGFRRAHPDGYGHGNEDIFITPCIDLSQDRHHPDHVRNTIGIINRDLPDVDKPRLREATRRGTLTSCLHRANVAMTNFTRGIPLDAIDAPTLYELQHTIDFITTTLRIPDIDEVRAAVKGYLALNTDNTKAG